MTGLSGLELTSADGAQLRLTPHAASRRPSSRATARVRPGRRRARGRGCRGRRSRVRTSRRVTSPPSSSIATSTSSPFGAQLRGEGGELLGRGDVAAEQADGGEAFAEPAQQPVGRGGAGEAGLEHGEGVPGEASGVGCERGHVAHCPFTDGLSQGERRALGEALARRPEQGRAVHVLACGQTDGGAWREHVPYGWRHFDLRICTDISAPARVVEDPSTVRLLCRLRCRCGCGSGCDAAAADGRTGWRGADSRATPSGDATARVPAAVRRLPGGRGRYGACESCSLISHSTGTAASALLVLSPGRPGAPVRPGVPVGVCVRGRCAPEFVSPPDPWVATPAIRAAVPVTAPSSADRFAPNGLDQPHSWPGPIALSTAQKAGRRFRYRNDIWATESRTATSVPRCEPRSRTAAEDGERKGTGTVLCPGKSRCPVPAPVRGRSTPPAQTGGAGDGSTTRGGKASHEHGRGRGHSRGRAGVRKRQRRHADRSRAQVLPPQAALAGDDRDDAARHARPS